MIITISRELGAGGGKVARSVADALRWRLVDDELINEIAKRAGLSRAEVAQREERAPGFVERVIRFFTSAAPEILTAPEEVPELEEAHLVKVTESVVEEQARSGRVVVVGRAAPAVLARENAMHLKIVAPRQWRSEMLARRLGISEAAALAEIERSDSARARYHRQYYHRDWGDAANYDCILNTAKLGFVTVVETIVTYANQRWPELS